MAESEGGRRPRRAAAKAALLANQHQSAPSAMHYVGYVEEEETPEMIMQKFAQLEKIQEEAAAAKEAAAAAKAAAAAEAGDDAPIDDDATNDSNAKNDDDGFDEEMLLKVFKQTSQFSMKKALAEELFFDGDAMDHEDDLWDDEAGGWDLNDIFGKAKRKASRIARGPREPRAPKAPKKSHMITAYNSDNQMLMRKKREVDPRAPVPLKLPPHPIPVSWGKVIAPYKPQSEIDAAFEALPDCVHVKRDIVADAETLHASLGGDFLAVHANPPWDIERSPDRGGVTVEDIARIPFEKLAPYGFVFMWVEKENLSEVCDVMSAKQFGYVENMTWVQMRPNNFIANSDATYLARSHRTMVMFRRDCRAFPAAKAVELRHQRSADVTLDALATTKTGRRAIPAHVYKAMETLLPEAYKVGHPGKLLELWSEPGPEGRRSGWTTVADAAAAKKKGPGKKK